MELPLLQFQSLCSPSSPLDSCNSNGRVVGVIDFFFKKKKRFRVIRFLPLLSAARDQFLDGFVLEAYINYSIQSLGVCQIIICSCGGIVFFSGTHFSGTFLESFLSKETLYFF
jgi:hypothetical protein